MATQTPAVPRSSHSLPPHVWVLALTALGSFMVALDTLVVVTALPSIQRDLATDLPTLQWTVNAYELAYAAGVITAAALGDRLGRRRIFAIGLAVFTAASVACALAPDVDVLIAARTIQGLGAAMVTPLGLTILVSAFPAERRGTAIGILGGIAGLAIAAGPLVGGAVTQGVDWHWIFWLNVPVGLAATTLSRLRLPESYGPGRRLDLRGVGLVSAGAVGVVWGLVRGNDAGWTSPEIVVALGLGLLSLVTFVAWERRASSPLLPLRLFRRRNFVAATGTGFLMMAAQFAAAFLITEYLQLALGYSPLQAGLRFLPMTATPLVVAPLAGMLSDRIGARPLMAGGLLLQAIGLTWFAMAATPGSDYGTLVLPLLVAGIGVSMPFATVAAAVVGAVAPADTGKASGTASTLQTFGGVFGIAVVTAVFAGGGRPGAAAAFASGLRPALIVAAGFGLLGALSALATARSRQQALPASSWPATMPEQVPTVA